MINIPNITELFYKYFPRKVFQGIVVAVLIVMFFEQYTDYFELSRLYRILTIIQKTELKRGTTNEQIQSVIKKRYCPHGLKETNKGQFLVYQTGEKTSVFINDKKVE